MVRFRSSHGYREVTVAITDYTHWDVVIKVPLSSVPGLSV